MAAKKTTVAKQNPTEGGNKQKALEQALSTIEKAYGQGAIMKLGENAARMNVQVISTGCLDIDLALGVGGLPRGRIVEIYGPEASGKTTIALHCIASAQSQGGVAAFIDAEHALDPVYAKALQVNTDELYVSQPDNGEQALEICEALVRSGAVDMVVIDSVAALVPKAEIDGVMGDSHVGLHARLMSQALRKLAGIIAKSNCICIFINQLREKVGISYGNPEVTTGGRALKFYASVRLDVRKGEQIKSGTDVLGNHTRVKVSKNKVAPPFKVAEFDILYGEGVSREGSLIDSAVAREIIQKSGSWFSFKGERVSQGRENLRKYLKANPEVAKEIEQLVREAFAAEQPGASTAPSASKDSEAIEIAEDIGDEDFDLPADDDDLGDLFEEDEL